MKAQLALILVAACGGGGGNTNPGDPDAPRAIDAPKVFMDAPPIVAQMITVSGTAQEEGGSGPPTPLAGVVVAFYKTGSETTPMAMATSAADGKYSFELAANGLVIDGFLKASKSGYADNYVYPTAPLQADFTTGDANMVTTGNFGGLGILTGQQSSNGFIATTVLDASGQPVAGATIASTPASGKYAYSDNNGYPTGTTATIADGRAFFINAPVGDLTVTATKSGMTFKSHVLHAHANALTTTILAP